jgi:Cys-rich four helix bundle protein (predicted Tat secretion target)
MGARMRRRSFMAGLGLAAMADPSGADAPKPSSPPAPQTGLKPGFKELAEASGPCAVAGQACLRQALARLAVKDVALADVASSAAEVVAACDALTALAAANAPFAMGFARAVGDICAAGKKDFDKFPQIAECAALSAACGACVEACRKAAG